jgi:homoserine dehydrogenase
MAKVVAGMIGLGTVGTGVVRLLAKEKKIFLKKVAVRDINKARADDIFCSVTNDVYELINDPEIELIIEVMGSDQPAYEYLTAALEKRKHVVTANKEVLAKHGPELFALAKKKHLAIFFEASVAGGIPLISTMLKGLEANQINSVTGILNGTTNFILSSMEEHKISFASALAQAQALGFAEADPSADVEGFDVAYKLSILSALAFGHFVKPDSIYREGITKIGQKDLEIADSFGYRIKLVGTASRFSSNGNPKLDVRVQPMLIPKQHLLANISGSNNVILVNGDAVEQLAMVGPGAGQLPTASAIVGDVINLANALHLPDFAEYFQPEIESGWSTVTDEGNISRRFYMRLVVHDVPGVIGKIGTILGKNEISIQSIVQRGVKDEKANVIILTDFVRHSAVNKAAAELKGCDFLDELANLLAIFEEQ